MRQTTSQLASFRYELAYSAMALATSSVESFPPSPRPVRPNGGHVVGAEFGLDGKNVVCRPRRDRVIYRDGIMTAPAETAFQTNRKANWVTVAVEAPKGLCGMGGVHMIGAWDLMGRHQPLGDDNVALLTRLFEWLSGTPL